jgi:hypothetical protein
MADGYALAKKEKSSAGITGATCTSGLKGVGFRVEGLGFRLKG